MSGLDTNQVRGSVNILGGYFSFPSLTVCSISYLVSTEIPFLFLNYTTQRLKINVLKSNHHYYNTNSPSPNILNITRIHKSATQMPDREYMI